MQNEVKSGVMMTHLVAGAAVVSGQGLLVNNLFGVCAYSAAIGEEVELQTTGVFTLPRDPADTPAAFAAAYWDAGASRVTTEASGNTLIGVFAKAYAASADPAQVRLNGVSTP